MPVLFLAIIFFTQANRDRRSFGKGAIMGFTEVLTIVFVVMKLLGNIDWSWFCVLLPEIIAVAIYILICIIVVINTYRANKEIEKLFGKD